MKKKNLSVPLDSSWFPAFPLDLGVLQPTLRSPGKEREAARKQEQPPTEPQVSRRQQRSSQAAAAQVLIDARQEGHQVNLEWQLASGHSADQLLIERSGDGIAFHEIGKLPLNTTSGKKTNYCFTDRRPLAGMNYYRLRRVQRDGQAQCLARTAIAFEAIAAEACHLHLHQQPVHNELRLSWDMPAQQQSLLRIFNLVGQLQLEQPLREGSTSTKLSLEKLPAGTYVLQLSQQQRHDSLRFRKI